MANPNVDVRHWDLVVKRKLCFLLLRHILRCDSNVAKRGSDSRNFAF
jgi:hypothetical protein